MYVCEEITAKEITLIFTKHAIQRIYERGWSLESVIEYLRQNKLFLMYRNKEGYEIRIPMKGRLVGDFEDKNTFIVKSYLYPNITALTVNRPIHVLVRGVLLPRAVRITNLTRR